MGILAGYLGTVIVDVELFGSAYVFQGTHYECALGDVNAAESGTVALNFSKGKYIGLGIPIIRTTESKEEGQNIPPAKDNIPG